MTAASLTSEPEKLLPCPFCKGSPKIANGPSRRSDGTGWLRRVICLDCEAAGPQEHDDDEAAAMWNRRLSSPVSGTDMVMRERVARTCDPVAWGDHDYWAGRLRGEGRWPTDPAAVASMRASYERRMPEVIKPSLEKADQIIAMLAASPTPPIPMIVEAGEREADAFEATDAKRTIEILSRALAWHGDPQRMATTREEWQQTIDTAIAWVKTNPEPGRVSFSTWANVTPATLNNTAVEVKQRLPGREALACVIFNAASDRFMRFSQCYPIADAVLATLTAKTEKADTATQVNEGDR